jgi:predicted nuclease of restriction endonuclease-like (RecB) superfamily
VSHKFETPPDMLIGRLSFSHIREIMEIDDPFERFFYEFECVKGTWSVRELKQVRDPYGNRWIKCEYCDKIAKDTESRP